MPTTIKDALRAALGADPTLTHLLGDRIFPGEIPDDETAPPWLYYAVPESIPFDELDGEVLEVRSEVEFHALAVRDTETQAVIDAVTGVLNTYREGVINRALWLGSSEESTEDGYHHAARFVVWWRSPLTYSTPEEEGYASGFSLHGIMFPVG